MTEPMAPGRLDLRVRFSETDANGHVSHLSYLIYCEDARTRLMQHPAIGYSWPRDRYNLVLVAQSIRYHQPAYFPDELHVETAVTRVGRSSLGLTHTITRDDVLIAESECTLVLVDVRTNHSTPWPDAIRTRLTAHETAHG